jgi:hypothetical protein
VKKKIAVIALAWVAVCFGIIRIGKSMQEGRN